MQLRRKHLGMLTDHSVEVFLCIGSAHLPSRARGVFTEFGVYSPFSVTIAGGLRIVQALSKSGVRR
jgi:hypothetical protein